MNVLSLYNKAFLEGAQASNNNIQNLNGAAEVNKIDEEEEEKLSFVNMMNTAIDNVNKKQMNADSVTNKFMSGEIEDLHSVMIATEEARISLELAVQVRNKCIEAFKEINNMQL